MYEPKKLLLRKFSDKSFESVGDSDQIQYLCCYLIDLGAASILIEPYYFDRDYLAEFSAFYGTSSCGYPNVCQRWHYFGADINRTILRKLLGGSTKIRDRLQESYFGFSVVRPIPAAPLGRTVLSWYPDTRPATPRNSTPSRPYEVHIAGVSFKVTGLAWQQQDTGVGACATVGLWSVLHSSAFDDHHAIPTTAEITQAAHKTASLGRRVFPSAGLASHQLAEAIKENHLAPVVINGDIDEIVPVVFKKGFSRPLFASSCGAFIRSGYPVLLGGYLENAGGHAVCAVGFREPSSALVPTQPAELADAYIEHLYVHDDNLGPSVRFKIQIDPTLGVVVLKTDPPPPRLGARPCEPTLRYPRFFPCEIIAAVHDDLRMSPSTLLQKGTQLTRGLEQTVNNARLAGGLSPIPGFWYSGQFLKLSDYLSRDLANAVRSDNVVLSRARLELFEKVSPMSLQLGVTRIALTGAIPVVDFLFDTTDSDRAPTIFAHVCYVPDFERVVEALATRLQWNLGIPVVAYR